MEECLALRAPQGGVVHGRMLHAETGADRQESRTAKINADLVGIGVKPSFLVLHVLLIAPICKCLGQLRIARITA